MVQVLSRSMALLLAVALVGVTGLVFSQTYQRDRFSFTVVCPCIWFYPKYAGWEELDANRFRIRAPQGMTLRQTDRFHGTIGDFRFTLSYAVDELPAAAPAASAMNLREEPVDVGGRRGVIRTAEVPGHGEPYFIQLIVLKAVKAKDGRWQSLEIHGWMLSEEHRWLAGDILNSVDFSPPSGRMMLPSRPVVPEPVIVIEGPEPRSTP